MDGVRAGIGNKRKIIVSVVALGAVLAFILKVFSRKRDQSVFWRSCPQMQLILLEAIGSKRHREWI